MVQIIKSLYMTEDKKLSTGMKIFILLGAIIFLSAMAYIIYIDFFTGEKKEFSSISIMFVCLIVGIVTMRPVFKRW